MPSPLPTRATITATRHLRRASKRLLTTQTAITRFLSDHSPAVSRTLSPTQSTYFRQAFHALIGSILGIFVDADELFGDAMGTWWVGERGMELLMALFRTRVVVQRVVVVACSHPEDQVPNVWAELGLVRGALEEIGRMVGGFAWGGGERRVGDGDGGEEEMWMDGLEEELEELEREMREMEEGGEAKDEEGDEEGGEESVAGKSVTEKVEVQEETAATGSHDVAADQERRDSNDSGYFADDEDGETHSPVIKQHRVDSGVSATAVADLENIRSQQRQLRLAQDNSFLSRTDDDAELHTDGEHDESDTFIDWLRSFKKLSPEDI